MQVFLPYPDLKQSVCCLDPKRLGNQVYRECLTLIRGGWPNHPVAKMWVSHRGSLAAYALYGLNELDRRGRHYPHHYDTFYEIFVRYSIPDDYTELGRKILDLLPSWFGDDRLHSSHRAALLHKDPEWYGQFGWAEQPAVPDARGRLPYYWPQV